MRTQTIITIPGPTVTLRTGGLVIAVAALVVGCRNAAASFSTQDEDPFDGGQADVDLGGEVGEGSAPDAGAVADAGGEDDGAAGPIEEIRLYLRDALGVRESTRHPDGTWDPIGGVVLPTSASLRQSSGVGGEGYLFLLDPFAGGVLLRESPPGRIRIVPLPPAPAETPPTLIGADVAAPGGGAAEVCAVTMSGHLLHAPGIGEPWAEIPGEIHARSELSCTAACNLLTACTVDSEGQVLATTRTPTGDGWQPWTDVEAQAGDLGAATRVRCRGAGGVLYLLAASERGAFFTERSRDGAFAPWQPLAAALDDPHADSLREIAVAGGEVHAIGSDDDGVWYTVRTADGWRPLADLSRTVTGFPARARNVSLATVSR
jgi:hypothetical protein